MVVVNQDGSGRTAFSIPQPISGPNGSFPLCDSGGYAWIDESSLNRMAVVDGEIYLFHPTAAMRVFHSGPYCKHMDFTGSAQGGLLAQIHRENSDASPELVVYELPTGRIRDRFPLLACHPRIVCDPRDASISQVEWSPNGRYLAFPAVWGGPSSDLFVYDSQTGSVRQLTSGAEWVNQIWWSPDGAWILLGEARAKNDPNTSAVWAISVSTSETRLLYDLDFPFPQGILGWLEPDRLIVFDGFIDNALETARNLRIVDFAGDSQLLFTSSFVTAELDDARKTVVLYALQDEYGQGSYLINLAHPTPQFLSYNQVAWDKSLDLYVTEYALDPGCEGDLDKVPAYDASGRMQCVAPPRPSLPGSIPSPDGQWQVTLKDGVGLAAANGSFSPVSTDPAAQATWCPNSRCFFFAANQNLLRVSVPERIVQLIDDQLVQDSFGFQWMAGEE
jgi:WD40 repeat protein